MSQQINNSLAGFLKKRSLFSNSPEKNKKEKSKEPREIINSPKENSTSPKLNKFSKKRSLYSNSPEKNKREKSKEPQEIINSPKENSTSPKLNNKFSETKLNDIASNDEYIYSQTQSRLRYPQTNKNTDEDFDRSRINKNPSLQEDRVRKEEDKTKWMNLVSHTVSFESARIQSIQCLEGLSIKIEGQILNIKDKIDAFNKKMSSIISEEFDKLRQRILETVEKVFGESENNIKYYMKMQEEKLAGELFEMKENLQKQYKKIGVMKEEISKSGWRKVAGELLASEMEQTIQEKLKKSASLKLPYWQLTDFGGHKIRELEEYLKALVKLPTSIN